MKEENRVSSTISFHEIPKMVLLNMLQILSFIYSNDECATEKQIDSCFIGDKETLTEALNILEEKEYVLKTSGGLYVITNKGKVFLEKERFSKKISEINPEVSDILSILTEFDIYVLDFIRQVKDPCIEEMAEGESKLYRVEYSLNKLKDLGLIKEVSSSWCLTKKGEKVLDEYYEKICSDDDKIIRNQIRNFTKLSQRER